MKRISSDSSTILVLDRGENLLQSLIRYADSTGLTAAWMSGLGGAMNLTLGFYDIKIKEYIWEEFHTPLEIVSLTGNLSIVDNAPVWHIHGVFSGKDYQAISGHVKELTVGLTGELLITPLSTPMTRAYDETTGLRLISPTE